MHKAAAPKMEIPRKEETSIFNCSICLGYAKQFRVSSIDCLNKEKDLLMEPPKTIASGAYMYKMLFMAFPKCFPNSENANNAFESP